MGVLTGSSPPTRGTLIIVVGFRKIRRFIPAHAGNTMTFWGVRRRLPVHPRPRGEHLRSRKNSPLLFGSSPPTRGTPAGKYNPICWTRFIPAHAGNTTITILITIPCSVHPRPRGEHPIIDTRAYRPSGSSPPTRGTPPHARSIPILSRFIPAHAGNTIIGIVRSHGHLGSSPPTRGTPGPC